MVVVGVRGEQGVGLEPGPGEQPRERFELVGEVGRVDQHRLAAGAQRELRGKDDELYVERAGPLALGEVQTLPVPGSVELGSEELELHPAEGHTTDGMAVMARWCGILCVGDYLSNVEIPMVESGLGDYRATLARLAPLVEAAEVVVPGHGMPSARDEALGILDEDVDYLDALERGEEKARLPKGRDSREQRKIHAENLARV